MTAHSVVLENQDLAELAAEFSLGKPSPSSGPVPGWGYDRYRIYTAKGRFEVRVHSMDEEFDLRRELDFLSFLEKHDFPSPRPVLDGQGRYLVDRAGYCLTLYRLPLGQAVAEKKLSLKQINNAGYLIGQMHAVCRGYKKSIENRFGFERIFETYAAARRRMPSHFKKIVRTLDEETEYLGNYLEAKLPKGIIHGAIHRDSLLFKGEEVTCIGDFEGVCRGKYVFDLATAVNALCFYDSSYSLDRFEALMAGYEAVRTLSLAEWDSFPNELRFAALRFTVLRMSEFFETPDEVARARVNQDFGAYIGRLRVLRREEDGGMEHLLMAMATGYDYRKYQRVKGGEAEGSGG